MMESSSLPQKSERFQSVGLFETCTGNHPEYEHTDRRITIVSAQAFLQNGLQQLKRALSQSWKLAGKNMDIKSDMKTRRAERSVSYWLRCGVHSSKETCMHHPVHRVLPLCPFISVDLHQWPSLKPARYLQQHRWSCLKMRSFQGQHHQSLNT